MIFQHKDEWRVNGSNFCIVISKHEVTPSPDEELFRHEGIYRWAVYAYIYPKHPRFALFSGKSIFQDGCSLPLHGGCSYIQSHELDGKITSWQVGADYHHDGDSHFTELGTLDRVTTVVYDAERLYDFLQKEDGIGKTIKFNE